MRLPSILLAPILLAACAGAGSDPVTPSSSARIVEARTGEPVTLGVGETARFDGGRFAVTFRRVTQDSRCPSTVRCVWSGDGAVLLWLQRRGLSAAVTLHTVTQPQSSELEGYTVTLLDLRPYPADDPIEPTTYRVTVKVRGESPERN